MSRDDTGEAKAPGHISAPASAWRREMAVRGERAVAVGALALGAVATAALTRALRADAAGFAEAKRSVFIGAGIGFLLWFTGFMVVGGRYFAMWQSRIWNGQEAAFRFYLTLLAVLIFVNQPDAELRRPRHNPGARKSSWNAPSQ